MIKKLIPIFVVLIVFVMVPGQSKAVDDPATIQSLQRMVTSLTTQVETLQNRLNEVLNANPMAKSYQGYDNSQMKVVAQPNPALQSAPAVISDGGSNSSPKFSIGQRVQTNDYLNVRIEPNGSSVGVQPNVSKGIIQEGPQTANGYIWYKINYDNGPDGWSVQNWLEPEGAMLEGVAGNKAPILADDALVSPTSVGVGDSNWWRLEATDPEGGLLTYSIDWGDGKTGSYSLVSGASEPARHTYNQIGKYIIALSVSDAQNAKATRSVTVDVFNRGNLVASTKFKIGDGVEATDAINVRTAPNGVWNKTMPAGSRGTVLSGPVWSILGDWWWEVDYGTVAGWSSENWLKKSDGVAPVVYYSCADMNNDGVISIDDINKIKDYIFSGGTLVNGMGDVNGDGVINISDVVYLVQYISNGGPAPKCTSQTQQPSLQVTYPNGGEYLVSGQSYVVTWKFANVKKIKIYECANPSSCLILGGIPDIGIDATAGQFSWKTDVNDPLTPGNIKIRIKDVDSDTFDESNDYIVLGRSSFACGDVNHDGKVNTTDSQGIIHYIFPSSPYTGTFDLTLADVNGSKSVNISDSVYLIAYLNSNGPAPRCSVVSQNQLSVWFVTPSVIGNALLSGGVFLEVKTDRAVVGVQYKIDGVNVAPEDVVAPYGLPLDTRILSNGPHTFLAVVRDSSGNIGEALMKVSINNAGSSNTTTTLPFACGDVNHDGKVNTTDSQGIIHYIFPSSPYTGTFDLTLADVNGSKSVNISDSVYLIAYLNSNGPAPRCSLLNTMEAVNNSGVSASVYDSMKAQLDLISRQLQSLFR